MSIQYFLLVSILTYYSFLVIKSIAFSVWICSALNKFFKWLIPSYNFAFVLLLELLYGKLSQNISFFCQLFRQLGRKDL